ncbi:hypothetical protein GQE99_03970 [Maritimibacter sp. DP07]|uniref:Uncharacterized protein n=1 Tax=Maritimibacter harenae TaxID=2606218 RepID=A0A845LWK7_9RHOB|nr:hypothetical protein [Maritimibacter harenae]MZR12175.1 hypothetical protein [Maritimibacter harenae]
MEEKSRGRSYRVRLFLSVDLSGSTAFKNSASGEQRDSGATPRWVTLFEQFYTNFPDRYAATFDKQRTENMGSDHCPKLWKAVGDELVFCGRVTTKLAVATALKAFIHTLHEYRKVLADGKHDLNLKGAGFLAAFPEPNRAVKLRREGAAEEPDMLSASEALEAAADAKPFDYDFLGKAIDTGFRVAHSAKPERFALSVQLARLLAEAEPGFGFDFDIHLEQPMPMKGVNKGEAYPSLFIDTLKHLPTEKTRKLERNLLSPKGPPDRTQLAEYLVSYCEVVGTDEIMLPDNADGPCPDSPPSYQAHRSKIAEHLAAEIGRGSAGDDTPEGYDKEDTADVPPSEPLNPLPKLGE